MNTKFAIVLYLFGAAVALRAAPELRLTQTAVGPLLVAQGANGQLSATQIPYAYNAGDGSLNLKVASTDSWLSPTLGPAQSCGAAASCIPVRIALQTSGLAKGAYTGFVTVSDPNAVDAPQTISVTVDIGGNVPSQLTLYAPPNGVASSSFVTTPASSLTASTQSGGPWLSVAGTGFGSFSFSVTYAVNANAASLSPGDYNGSVAVRGSSLASDNQSIPVVLHVTAQPIAEPTPAAVQFTIAQGAAKQNYPIAVTNAGQGTLTVSGASVTTASGGNWLTAQSGANNTVTLTADSNGLAPGSYQGTLTIDSNAANHPAIIPVQLAVEASGPPLTSFSGVVNNGTFSPLEGLAQGEIAAVFGGQFTMNDAVSASSLPLGTTLGNTQVLINNQPVPVYYVSSNQINIQIPYDAPTGAATLSVARNGTAGNSVSLNISRISPVILLLSGGPYGIMTTPAGALTGIPGAPAHAGDVIVLYALGLGATNPSVASGAASPASPLAVVSPTPQVCFGGSSPFAQNTDCATPQFAGLTPGFVGLYQINFTVPGNVPAGSAIPMYIQLGNAIGNVISIDIQ